MIWWIFMYFTVEQLQFINILRVSIINFWLENDIMHCISNKKLIWYRSTIIKNIQNKNMYNLYLDIHKTKKAPNANVCLYSHNFSFKRHKKNKGDCKTVLTNLTHFLWLLGSAYFENIRIYCFFFVFFNIISWAE